MTHPVDTHVGRQLRIRRTILGMSQDALAKAAGITFQQIQKYERGVNRMSASRLFDFARVLGVPVSYFFEGLDEKATRIEPVGGMAEAVAEGFGHEQILSRETLEMMRAFHRINNPALKKRVADLLRAIGEEKIVMDVE